MTAIDERRIQDLLKRQRLDHGTLVRLEWHLLLWKAIAAVGWATAMALALR